MNRRHYGYAAVAAGALLLLAVMMGPVIYPLALGMLLLAVAGLSASWGRERTRWAWVSTLLPAGGLILSLLGIGLMALLGNWTVVVGDFSAYQLFAVGLLVALAGSALFAGNVLASDAAQRPPAVLLVVGAAVLFFGLTFQTFAWSPAPGALVNNALVGGATLYAISWIWLGFAVALKDRSAPAAPP